MKSDQLSSQTSAGPARSWLERVVGWFSAPVRPVSLDLRSGESGTSVGGSGTVNEESGQQTRLLTTGSLRRLAQRLFVEELDPLVGQNLVREVCENLPRARWGNDVDVFSTAAQLIVQQCLVSGPITVSPRQRNVVALVGPTGVGKSTTVAKLAALAAYKDGKSVGLISTDTYRVAAVEQLRVYAQLLKLPMSVAGSQDEIRAILETYDQQDLVFVDTAGQSPNDRSRLDEVRSLLGAGTRIHTFLVISATTKHTDVKDILRQFEPLGYEGLVVTKLDESRSHGILLNAPYWCGKPLAYLGIGQEVPTDLEVAESARVADLVLDLSGRFSASNL